MRSGRGAGDPVKTEPPVAAADDKSDWLKVVADHTEAAKGPVDVVFKGIKVVKADFDPAKVEGGTAELEIDLNTLESGIPKRNDHLKSADYLNAPAAPSINVKIANVKKTGDNAYSADATVKLNGNEKTYPVTFNVVETMADGIRIKGEHKFLRTDFKVGKAEGDGAKPELSATLQLTLKKT